MKKTFNNFWPFSKKVQTKYSGTVQVTWLNGRKVLNSKHANYSYGSLQRVLEIGLSHTTADRSAEVLVLGLGGGSVLKLLREKFNYYGKVTAVELDPVVINVAIQEFGIRQYEPLEIVCTDALEYIKLSKKDYALIIIDVFLDLDVPAAFFGNTFWEGISCSLVKGGKVLFNAGIYEANQQEIDGVQQQWKSEIEFRKLEHINGTNTLLLGTKT